MKFLIYFLSAIFLASPIIAQETGSLMVATNPNVKIYLDEVLIGETNEMGLFKKTEIAVGEYSFKAEKKDYVPYEAKIKIEKDEQKDIFIADFTSIVNTNNSKKVNGGSLKEESKDSHRVIDKMPELIGGMKRLLKQIKYPQTAKNLGVEGRVEVKFTVNKKGKVENATIKKGIGWGCDEEALRVIKKAKFKPGIVNGEFSAVEMTLPVKFSL